MSIEDREAALIKVAIEMVERIKVLEAQLKEARELARLGGWSR